MASSSRSLITRLAPYFSARLRYDSRLLSSSSALQEPQPSSSESLSPMAETLHITDTCVRIESAGQLFLQFGNEAPSFGPDLLLAQNFTNIEQRMKELQADEAGEKMLRFSIEAGGCSGFQYNFSLDDKIKDDDKIFEQDGVRLVVDNISFDFVKEGMGLLSSFELSYLQVKTENWRYLAADFYAYPSFISRLPLICKTTPDIDLTELISNAECSLTEVSLPFGHSNYTTGSFCSNIKIMGYTSTRLYYLKKVIAILLSVSVFSFLFSQSSPAPLLLHWYDHFVSNLYAKLFSYTPHRIYIFLLFNGILVLILGTSGLINKIKPTHSREQGARIPDHQTGLQEIPVSACKEVKEIVEGNEDHEGSNNETTEEGEERGGIDEEMVMSMDELNKKCEDFITRVKLEIQAA